jgi:hypothetical protein
MCVYNDMENGRYIVGGYKLHKIGAKTYGNISIFNNSDWTVSNIDTTNDVVVTAIFKLASQYIIIGYIPSTETVRYYYSTNLLDWEERENNRTIPDSLDMTRIVNTCTYNGYLYMKTWNEVFKGTVLQDYAGIDWEQVYTSTNTIQKMRLIDNSLWLIESNKVCISSDGVKWETVIEHDKYDIKDVIFLHKQFIVYTDDDMAYISSDKYNWSKIVTSWPFQSPGGIVHVITYKNIALMFGLSTSKVAVSSDGINWILLEHITSGESSTIDTNIDIDASGMIYGMRKSNDKIYIARLNYDKILHLFMIDFLNGICRSFTGY